MADRFLIRTQALSGLVLSVFIALHLANFFAASLGPEAYDSFQRALRPVYKNPAVELLALALALLLHVGASLLRIRRRRRQLKRARSVGARPKPPRWPLRLHRFSAYYLLVVTFGHAAVTRLPSLLFGVWPESAGLAFSLWWMPWFFYPYFTLFALAGVHHTLYGFGLALRAIGLPGVKVPTPARMRTAFILALLLSAGALLALGNPSEDRPAPTDNDYARLWERYGAVTLPLETE